MFLLKVCESDPNPIRSDRIRTVIHLDRIGFLFFIVGSDFVGFLSDRIGFGFFLVLPRITRIF